MAFLPGTMFLIDTSAASRLGDPQVISAFQHLLDGGIAATCVTVDLEAAWSVPVGGDVGKLLAARQQDMVTLEIDERAAQRARAVMRMLAERGMHRSVGPLDLLIAAVAELHRAIVLHYDADFEHIASVTGQRQEWIVPRGSV